MTKTIKPSRSRRRVSTRPTVYSDPETQAALDAWKAGPIANRHKSLEELGMKRGSGLNERRNRTPSNGA
ncbi:MAG: hypothetical protein AB8B85_17220 [Paracoccaceae bacterium]